jgi:WD40 repeat protein
MGMVIWQAEDLSKPPHKVLNNNRKHFTDLAFHSSGRYLAATSNDATVKFYDTETWQVAKTFTWNVGRLQSIALSPDGLLAAAGNDTGQVIVWDVDL